MIVLDTHVWVWWVHGDEQLTQAQCEAITAESTQLPGEFHRDPADQIIVATARVYGCPLVTSDDKILNYPHVTTIKTASAN
jgi:PIN domain nuclease of toxin-antitoxin system